MPVNEIQDALSKARFEKIEDEEPYYAEIPGLRGVWATGKTRGACRKKLAAVLNGWITIRIKNGLDVPKVS
ncbi:type II toxin-antitoxin system HicB family antitoxin [bacterium]|nr:MAG: type II toxin-antitoxin system HicB family antitoxin [bacterium]